MTVIQSYNSKNIPSGKLHAVKIAKANLPYEFTLVFQTSLLNSKSSEQILLHFFFKSISFHILELGIENLYVQRTKHDPTFPGCPLCSSLVQGNMDQDSDLYRTGEERIVVFLNVFVLHLAVFRY